MANPATPNKPLLNATGFSAQVVGECHCGKTLTLHVINTAIATTAECPGCRTKYKIATISYDGMNASADTPAALNVGFRFERPLIEVPRFVPPSKVS